VNTIQRQVLALRIGKGQSIGSSELRTLWATACSSIDVKVTCMDVGENLERQIYGLWGGVNLNRRSAGIRMRKLLALRGYLFTLRDVGL